MQSNSKDTLLKYKYLVSKRTPLLHQNLCQLYSGLRTSFLCRDRNQKINEIITKKKTESVWGNAPTCTNKNRQRFLEALGGLNIFRQMRMLTDDVTPR